MDKFKFITNKNFDELPKTAGVYCFTEKLSEARPRIIYIGKAINIKNRVKNHFQQPSYRDNLFIEKINKIGFLETNSEIEALILEANLIKKHQPKYNVMWRDDKNYFYVAIENNLQKIPHVYITHQKNKKAIYIGPFTEGTAVKKTLRFLRRVFPYYSVKNHSKIKCTYCHLDLCPGINPDLKIYKKNIKNLIAVLKGKKNSVLKNLRTEMKNLSKENKFEEAAKTRDKIFALQQIMAHTRVINNEVSPSTSGVNAALEKIIGAKNPVNKIEAYDISNIQGKMATGSMIVFVNGEPDKSQYKKFKINSPAKPNDILMLKEILTRRFTHPEWSYPDAILIDGGKAQLNIAINSKSEARNSKQIKNSKSLIQNIKIISFAKGKQELWIENKKNAIPLKNLPQEIYNLIKNLDDEAHRFAISYHKKLREKNLLK